ncbi:MAG: SPOR domain-containing protein [Sphingomonadales bacterium]|nr:SPOR domain-containing protein [Sphingomonadales bacterium]
MRLPVEKSLPLVALTLLAACGGGGMRPDLMTQTPPNGPAADYPVVVGAPFTIDGVTYTPVDTMNYDAVGYAGTSAEGGATVSAAHRTLPLPSYVELTSLETGRTILVRIERRGPMAGSELIELSPGAAAQLGVAGQARAAVRVRRVNPVEPDRAALRAGQPAPARIDTPKSLLTVLQRKLDQQDGKARPVATDDRDHGDPATLPAKPEPKGKGKPAAKPKPNPTVAAPANAAGTPPPAPAARSGQYVVQIGAFSSKANAEATARKAGGVAIQSGKLWRVRAGPFASEAAAKAALAKAKSAGYSDARIQRAD